ncbi:MAG: hypothetical protein D6748_09460 [Calditrichaeota bacterium]|nr:MAG: hypothetical protein D6748_09460 [Calditrichota bacterium]
MVVVPMKKTERNIYIIAFLISLLFHVLLLFLLGVWDIFTTPLEASQIEESNPIVLEFEEPEQTPPPPQESQPEPEQPPPLPPKLYQVVENPNADEVNPDETALLAEHSSRAAAPETQTSGGDIASQDEQEPEKIEDFVPDEQESSSRDMSDELENYSGEELISQYKPQRTFSKKLIGESTSRSNQKKAKEDVSPLSSREFQADLIGEMRMSTYAWDWAPWWKAFERKILHHWYAPTAWQMGLISGYTYVKIRVNQKGELMSYEVLKHVGHESLKTSSINALESVFPFKALPPDFPEDFLEIKFVMIYPDLKELFRRHSQ